MVEKVVVIVGGYGVVGRETATLLRKRHPDVKLVIVGRRAVEADALAAELGNAVGAGRDLDEVSAAFLREHRADVLLSAVSDKSRRLLHAAIDADVAYIDFAVSGQTLIDSINLALQPRTSAPVALVSNWMAGVPAVIAQHLSQGFDVVDEVSLDILYYGNDRGGPDTANSVEHFAEPFLGWRNNQWQTVRALSEPKRVSFMSGHTRTTLATNLPDVTSLVYATGARSVFVRLGMERELDSVLLRGIVRSGLWSLFPVKLKKSIMYNPGEGANHELVVTVQGTRDGQTTSKRVSLLDPQGQVHLTALGVVHAIEQMLGVDGEPGVSRPGPIGAEALGDAQRLYTLLAAEGVSVER